VLAWIPPHASRGVFAGRTRELNSVAPVAARTKRHRIVLYTLRYPLSTVEQRSC